MVSWRFLDEWREIFTKQSHATKLISRISVYKAPHWALYQVWFQNESELYKQTNFIFLLSATSLMPLALYN